MADQLDNKGARDFRYSEVDLNPMFVLAQVLERGQYFVSGIQPYRLHVLPGLGARGVGAALCK